jgi:hypothetical protein
MQVACHVLLRIAERLPAKSEPIVGIEITEGIIASNETLILALRVVKETL